MSDVRSTSSDSTVPLLPDHPLTHTTLVFVPILHKTLRMAVRVPPMMSPGLSAVKKRYRGTFKLILGTDSEEDEEVKESSEYDSESEDVEDKDPTAEDEDPAVEDEDDESHGLDDESYGIDGEGYDIKSDGLGLGEEEADRELKLEEDHVYSPFEVGQGSGSTPKPERSERVSTFRQPTLTTWTDLEDGMVYIDVPIYPLLVPPVQTPPSLEWTSGSLLISPSPFVVPLLVSSPMIPLVVPSPIGSPMATSTATISLDDDQFIEAHAGIRGMGRACCHSDDRYVTGKTTLHQELQDMRDHMTVLEPERDRREW
nr:hypothetical protein [Tanacetum cinerariifolium]